MNTRLQAPPSASSCADQQNSTAILEEQHARAKAKAEKKERKHARLRFFFGWCAGCQAFGSAF
jgi:hypothetical protein